MGTRPRTIKEPGQFILIQARTTSIISKSLLHQLFAAVWILRPLEYGILGLGCSFHAIASYCSVCLQAAPLGPVALT